MAFSPADPAFAARVAAGFAAQPFMALIGARLGDVAPGRVEIVLPVTPALGQQHGYVHAGAAWSIADSAAGFAAQTLMPADHGVLTVELKINLMRPATGHALRAVGTVERAGRQLTVCRSEVLAEAGGGTVRTVALALGTFMAVPEPAQAIAPTGDPQ